jgi:stress response protein SCP2
LQSLGLAWDFAPGTQPIDLDASALIFDFMGSLLDAAYFNQLSAANGSVLHSGDNTDGAGSGADEVITIHSSRLPPTAKIIVIVLNAYKGGSLGDLETASAKLHAGPIGGPVLCDLSLGAAGNATGAVMCVLYEDYRDKTWHFKDVGDFTTGRNFMACMPTIRPVVDSLVDPIVLMERTLSVDKPFKMKKNDDMALPASITKYRLGLGWTCRRNFDLDASCILLGQGVDAAVVDTVYFSNKSAPGVRHSGDNTTGAGAGDDEQINVDLQAVAANVSALVFVVNIYTVGGSFSQVSDAYIRLCDAKGKEMARYTLGGHVNTRGLVFCKLYRSGTGWRMIALGQGADGSTAKDAGTVDVVRGFKEPIALTEGGGGGNGAQDGCCIVM